MCECWRVNRLQSIQGFIVAARRGGMTWSGRCAEYARACLCPSISLPVRVSLYIHLNQRDSTSKRGDIERTYNVETEG